MAKKSAGMGNGCLDFSVADNMGGDGNKVNGDDSGDGDNGKRRHDGGGGGGGVSLFGGYDVVEWEVDGCLVTGVGMALDMVVKGTKHTSGDKLLVA